MEKYSRTPIILQLIWMIRSIIVLLLLFLFFQENPISFSENTDKNTENATVIVLDISKSMETDDLKPSRIEFAKNIILDHLDQNEIFGLIIFAGKTFILSPITDDSRGVRYLLEMLKTDTINQNQSETSGTNIGDALIQASSLFEESTVKKNIILITDGRANIGLDPIVAANVLKEKNISLSILALGSSTDIPLTHIVHGIREELRDSSGNTINGSVDIATLSGIADITGGKLLHISHSDQRNISDTVFHLPKIAQTDRKGWVFDELFIVFMIIILSVFHMALSFSIWHRYKTR